MADLADLQDTVLGRLRAKHDARERSLAASRDATRHAANAIRAVHREERDLAAELIGRARQSLAEAEDACSGHPAVEHAGFLADARKEYVEACATDALVAGAPLPGPDDLGTDEATYLNGLAEAVGELRRRVLDRLRVGDLAEAEALLGAMDDIYALLTTIDFPDGVTGGLRRSTDMVRGITERTRGDVTTALVGDRLRDALERHRRDVLEDTEPGG